MKDLIAIRRRVRREVTPDARCAASGSLRGQPPAWPRSGWSRLTWGNASGMDRGRGLVVIKPSGVPYDELQPEQMVVVDLEGHVVEGDLRPSSDTPTHLCPVSRISRTSAASPTRTAATPRSSPRPGAEIPCLGTTHADHFHGPVPVTRPLSEAEVAERLRRPHGPRDRRAVCGLDPAAMPAVLVAGHGPFTWGATPAESVHNARGPGSRGRNGRAFLAIDPQTPELEAYICGKHYRRKHGPRATYGQNE